MKKIYNTLFDSTVVFHGLEIYREKLSPAQRRSLKGMISPSAEMFPKNEGLNGAAAAARFFKKKFGVTTEYVKTCECCDAPEGYISYP